MSFETMERERPAIQFKRAVRQNAGLIIGLIGGTGSGKTFSAMRMASGISGDKPFAVIDTEAGRALHYADMFLFDHADLHPPFRPYAYTEAIMEADRAGYRVIVVDSCSHEWEGEGGVLEWADANKKGKSDSISAWIEPKSAHKRMMQRLIQLRAHIILCFRAEDKTAILNMEKAPDKKRAEEMITQGLLTRRDVDNKRTVIVPGGWQPICEKRVPYELTCSFLFTDKAPGVPQPLKLQEQHKPFFPPGEQVSEDSGRRIAAWASGGAPVDPARIRGARLARYASLKADAIERGVTDAQRQDFFLARNLKSAAEATDADIDAFEAEFLRPQEDPYAGFEA